MRARDFVTENKKKKMHHGIHNPQFSGVHLLPDVDQGYELYRLAMDMATAGKENPDWPDKEAFPSSDKSVIVAYSEGDHEIVSQVLKRRGIKHKDTSEGNSREFYDTHAVSPVAKIKKNKYGV
jgi:hypothetical protein